MSSGNSESGSLKPTSETTSRVLIRLRKQSIDYFRDSYKWKEK